MYSSEPPAPISAGQSSRNQSATTITWKRARKHCTHCVSCAPVSPSRGRRCAISELDRREGESELAHHRRLVFGKLADRTLSDFDYAELAQSVYGKEYAPDVARRMMYGSRFTLDLLERSPPDDDDDAPQTTDRAELRKERQKLFDERAALNKLLRDRARQEELNELITSTVANGDLPALNWTPQYTIQGDNDLLVSLNDIHFGADVDNHWQRYNSDICAAMLRNYLSKVLSVAQTHGSENCIVWANGDLINGNIHTTVALSNKENVIEQIMGVAELIAQFLSELSAHFGTVKYVSVAGNHSRIAKKDEAMKDERLDDLVEWYLAARLRAHGNVIIGAGEKLDSTMYVIDVRGRRYLGVHGDYDSSNANVQSLQTMSGGELYAILSGHKHHNKSDYVQGIRTIIAGSFIGMDDYCITKRIVGIPQQVICVCDYEGVRCSYDVKLN